MDYVATVMALSVVFWLWGIVREHEGDNVYIFKTIAGCLVWVVRWEREKALMLTDKE